MTSYRTAGDHRAAAIGPIRAKGIVDRARSIAERAQVTITVAIEPATPPAGVVLEWAHEHDLLATGAPAGSWLGGALFTGVADAAVGSFAKPLLATRLHDVERDGELYRHVVVASDGLADSEQPIALAGAIARAHGSRVTLLHALGRPHHRIRQRIAEQERELARAAGYTANVLLHPGFPQHVLHDCLVELEPSLTVIGSRRRTGLRTVGSVSRRIVHDAPSSVLLVPPA